MAKDVTGEETVRLQETDRGDVFIVDEKGEDKEIIIVKKESLIDFLNQQDLPGESTTTKQESEKDGHINT
ncbi:hypothetical protein JOD44_001723 [Salimicrobium jeotgali]|nr:hypothetical protein [Salimicrobium jeotgali]